MANLYDPEVLKFIAKTEAAFFEEAALGTPAEVREAYDEICKFFGHLIR